MIKTKLFLPRVRPERVERSRLTLYLNRAVQYPFTLVSSLAGSGKTTALVEWVNQLWIPAAWFSIDEGDNDFNRFLAYFISAFQTAAPGVGKTALEAARSSEPLSPENIFASIINDLVGFSGEIVLILDDYHRIKSPAVHQAIAFFVEHIPPSIHLVMATRADPKLPLARYRVRDSILELRMDQLRFTQAETAEYMNRVMQLGLAESDLLTLRARTEGWIASLQLAALSLKPHPDEKAFIQAFSGTNRFVLDYLVEEVLNQQSGEIQTFLLQTCILDRMCSALCDAVTGQNNSQETLESIERNNLFVVPLDDERGWYRYHHLFTDLLRARLAHFKHGDYLESLHSRASCWYEQHGFAEDAIQHALAARDYDRAARLVEGAAEDLWLSGQYSIFLAWNQALPQELVRCRPGLCIWQAWTLIQMGSLQDVSAWIDAAQAAAQKQGASFAPGGLNMTPAAQGWVYEITILRALLAGLAQDYALAFDLAGRVLETPPSQNKKSTLVARCNISHGMSSMQFAMGDLVRAEQTCQETIRLAQEIGFTLRQLHAVNKLAYIYKATGQLMRSFGLIQDTLAQLQEQGSSAYFAAGSLHCRRIDLLYEWNQLADAQRWIETQLNPQSMANVPYLWVDFYNLQARSLLLEQDYSGAQSLLDKAAALSRQSYIWPGLAWQTESTQVRLWLQCGEWALAATWAGNQPGEETDPIPFSNESRQIALARIQMAQGAARPALQHLERLAAAAEAGGRCGSLIEIYLLQALACQAEAHQAEAAQRLEKALALAGPGGYIRTFLDEGEPVRQLLAKLAGDDRNSQHGYAQRLLSAFEEPQGAAPALPPADLAKNRMTPILPSPAAAPVEALSRRELEVLRCAAAGLSNSETAQRLRIETATVKRHINTIFAKLGVTNRVQALNKARELKLL